MTLEINVNYLLLLSLPLIFFSLLTFYLILKFRSENKKVLDHIKKLREINLDSIKNIDSKKETQDYYIDSLSKKINKFL